MVPAAGSDDLFRQLHVNNMENMQRPDIANLINFAFLEPMNSFNPLTTSSPFHINNYFLQLDVLEVFHLLKELNPGKASGPVDILYGYFTCVLVY